MKNTLLLFALLLSGAIFGQYPDQPLLPFVVDTAVISEVHKQPVGLSLGSMDVRMFESDRLLFSTFDSTKKMQILVIPMWEGDTLTVLGNAGMFQGFGFLLRLTQNKCQIFNRISVEMAPIYKLHQQDTTYQAGLMIPCTFARLTLASQPRYEAGEEITGIVELSGIGFLEKKRDAEGDTRYRMDLKAYFMFQIPRKY